MAEERKPRFEKTFCSQCGGEFGPGDHGYSHCDDHLPTADEKILANTLTAIERGGQAFRVSAEHYKWLADRRSAIKRGREVYEECAQICERRIIVTEHGERDVILAEPSLEHARTIRERAAIKRATEG